MNEYENPVWPDDDRMKRMSDDECNQVALIGCLTAVGYIVVLLAFFVVCAICME